VIRVIPFFDHELELLGMRPIVKMERREEMQRVTGRKFIRRVDVNLQHYSLSDSERTESDEVFALWVVAQPMFVVLYRGFGTSSRAKQCNKNSLTLEYGNNRLSQSAGKQLAT
jgi:hypothetical protein